MSLPTTNEFSCYSFYYVFVCFGLVFCFIPLKQQMADGDEPRCLDTCHTP